MSVRSIERDVKLHRNEAAGLTCGQDLLFNGSAVGNPSFDFRC
jgi:hypothetical protein